MGAIAAFLAAFLGRFFEDGLSFYLALKIFIIGAMTIILPLILKNIIVWLFASLVSIVQAQVGDLSFAPVVIEMTGLGAWLAIKTQLPLAFSIVMSCVATRFVLNMIPGIG